MIVTGEEDLYPCCVHCDHEGLDIGHDDPCEAGCDDEECE